MLNNNIINEGMKYAVKLRNWYTILKLLYMKYKLNSPVFLVHAVALNSSNNFVNSCVSSNPFALLYIKLTCDNQFVSSSYIVQASCSHFGTLFPPAFQKFGHRATIPLFHILLSPTFDAHFSGYPACTCILSIYQFLKKKKCISN